MKTNVNVTKSLKANPNLFPDAEESEYKRPIEKNLSDSATKDILSSYNGTNSAQTVTDLSNSFIDPNQLSQNYMQVSGISTGPISAPTASVSADAISYEQFADWLKGFVDIAAPDRPSKDQWDKIVENLKRIQKPNVFSSPYQQWNSPTYPINTSTNIPNIQTGTCNNIN